MQDKSEETKGASPTAPTSLTSHEAEVWLVHVQRWDVYDLEVAMASADRLIDAIRARTRDDS